MEAALVLLSYIQMAVTGFAFGLGFFIASRVIPPQQ